MGYEETEQLMVSTHLLKKYTGGTQLERGVAVTAEDQNSDGASLKSRTAGDTTNPWRWRQGVCN